MDRMEELQARKRELFAPIDQQVMMTDDKNDLLLLAANMAQCGIKIFVDHYGFEVAKTLVDTIISNMHNDQ